jgi:hypothetical protein
VKKKKEKKNLESERERERESIEEGEMKNKVGCRL